MWGGICSIGNFFACAQRKSAHAGKRRRMGGCGIVYVSMYDCFAGAERTRGICVIINAWGSACSSALGGKRGSEGGVNVS